MKPMIRGFIAGFVATIVLSVLMIAKGMMGLMPDVNVIAMLASKMGGQMDMGWLAHFMIGTFIYGLIFTFVFAPMPFGNLAFRGIIMGILGWLMMMVVVMPMMGAGLFGLSMPSGMMVPIATLMLHVIFGFVLGLVYCKLPSGKEHHLQHAG